jgi:small conductance mechanosensitive channel
MPAFRFHARTAVLAGIASALFAPAALAQQAAAPAKAEPTLFDAFAGFSSTLQARLPFFVAAVVILLASFVLARVASRMAERALQKSTVHRTAFAIFTKTTYVAALTIGLTVALKVAGLDISFVIGAATFGLGFAMKDLIENYISGVIIVLQEPFRVGDMVQVAGNFGWVEEIEARVTFVKSIDGQRVIIPNSQMISNALVNFSSFPQRRLSVKVGVSYDTDLQKAIAVIREVLDKDEEVLKAPAPLVLFQEFADSSLALEARFWIDQAVSHWLKVPSKVAVKVKQALDAAGINIPYPITTLNVNAHDSGDLMQLMALKQAGEARAAAEKQVRSSLASS